MDLLEAKKIYDTGWTLPCGHSSYDIKNDYYSSWCNRCGCEPGEPTEEFREALREIDKDFVKRRDNRRFLRGNLDKMLDVFLKETPFGSLQEFISTLK